MLSWMRSGQYDLSRTVAMAGSWGGVSPRGSCMQRRHMSEVRLEVDDIQGNIFPGFSTRFQRLLGFRFETPADTGAFRWLQDVGTEVHSMRDCLQARKERRDILSTGGERPTLDYTFVNVAFSIAGLRKLSFSTENIAEALFTNGMYWDAKSLGDAVSADAQSLPVNWKVGGSTETTPDALLIVGADHKQALEQKVQQLLAGLGEGQRYPGVSCFYDDAGALIPGDKEHFGFKDGISQVGIRGLMPEPSADFVNPRYLPPTESDAKYYFKPGSPLVQPGQFIFGYPSQPSAGDLSRPGTIAVGGEAWMKNGSYLVYRRLSQDVDLFRRETARLAESLNATYQTQSFTADRVQALLVGRWPDGTPLSVSPQNADANIAGDRLAINHFDYTRAGTPDVRVVSGMPPQERVIAGSSGDYHGLKCPLFAHIRQVNPRSAASDLGSHGTALAMQMLRRGVPFGPTVDEAPEHMDRGLHFISYQASIQQQFRRLNNIWMNSQHGPHEGGDDMLIGQGDVTLHPDHATRERKCFIKNRFRQIKATLQTTQKWTFATGGGYFFAPGKQSMQEQAARVLAMRP
jgi:Dyp-type peroxidase family